MIIVNIIEGMGDQMSHFASGLSLAKRLNTQLLIDNYSGLCNKFRPYCLWCFPNITERQATLKEIWKLCPGQAVKDYISPKLARKHDIFKRLIRKMIRASGLIGKGYFIGEKRSVDLVSRLHQNAKISADEIKELPGDIYLNGTFYSWDINELIRHKFKFDKKLFDHQDYNKIISCNSVAFHIRRGDKVNNPHFTYSNVNYIKNSVNKMLELTSDPEFFVFSDDLEWCKKNLPEMFHDLKFHFVEGKNPPQDMALMTKCKNIIMGPSNFSIWAAELNENPNAIKLAPVKYVYNPDDTDFSGDLGIKFYENHL